jgi:hypothetical protein
MSALFQDRLTDWTVGRNITLTLILILTLILTLSCGCEKWEAGSWGRELLGNPEEGERPSLEAATKQRLVKTEKTSWVL